MHGLLQPKAPSSTTANALATTGASVNVSNAAAPTEIGQILRIASLSPLAATWVKDSSRTYNVKEHGLTGDGKEVMGATITSGTNTLSCAFTTTLLAAFTADDVGKIIGVEGAGSSGGWLITTIATVIGSTSVTLSNNASTTVNSNAKMVFYGTNDLPAHQALLESACLDASTIGYNVTLYWPDGLYIHTGALRNNVTINGVGPADYNSQVCIPNIGRDALDYKNPLAATYGSVGRKRFSLTYLGDTNPHWMQVNGLGGTLAAPSGSRIRSTLINATGYFPSIIAARGTAQDFRYIGNVSFYCEKMQFEVTPQISNEIKLSCVNMSTAITAYARKCVFLPHNLDAVNSIAPTTTCAGILFPRAGVEPMSGAEWCLSGGGFKYGFISGEHCAISNSEVQSCRAGVGLRETSVAVMLNQLEANQCQYYMEAIGPEALPDGNADGRVAVYGTVSGEMKQYGEPYGGSTLYWYDTIGCINDPSNYLYGELKAFTTPWYAAFAAGKRGGANLRLIPMNGDATAVVTHTGTTYTLQYIYEQYQTQLFNNAAAITLTIPQATNLETKASGRVGFNWGDAIKCVQVGAGQITPTPASGVTIVFPTGKTKSSGVGAVFYLTKIAVNTWYVHGDLA